MIGLWSYHYRIVEKISRREPFKVYILVPMYPEGSPDDMSVQEMLHWQYLTMVSRLKNQWFGPDSWVLPMFFHLDSIKNVTNCCHATGLNVPSDSGCDTRVRCQVWRRPSEKCSSNRLPFLLLPGQTRVSRRPTSIIAGTQTWIGGRYFGPLTPT